MGPSVSQDPKHRSTERISDMEQNDQNSKDRIFSYSCTEYTGLLQSSVCGVSPPQETVQIQMEKGRRQESPSSH